MKTAITILSFLLIAVTSVDSSENTTKKAATIFEMPATFDAQEGNLLFFTDANYKALTIEDNDNKLFKDFEKSPNSYVDKSFVIYSKSNDFSNYYCSADDILKIELKE